MTDTTYQGPKDIFLNKRCKIHIFKDNSKLVYTGLVKAYNDKEIIFIDKYNCPYSYSTDLVKEVYEVKEDDQTRL